PSLTLSLHDALPIFGHAFDDFFVIAFNGFDGFHKHEAILHVLEGNFLIATKSIGEARPEAYAFAVFVIKEALAFGAAWAAEFFYHFAHHLLSRLHGQAAAFGFHRFAGSVHNAQGGFHADFINQVERAHRVARLLRCLFDGNGANALTHHGQAFAGESGDHAGGKEAAAIVHHNGGFLDL